MSPHGDRLVPPVRPTAVDVTAALQRLIDSGFPGHQGGELVLVMPGGRRLRVELTVACAQSGSEEMEANILQALEESAETLTGEKLAEAAGYSYSGAFRRVLKQLIDSGRVVNARPGYTLP